MQVIGRAGRKNIITSSGIPVELERETSASAIKMEMKLK